MVSAARTTAGFPRFGTLFGSEPRRPRSPATYPLKMAVQDEVSLLLDITHVIVLIERVVLPMGSLLSS